MSRKAIIVGLAISFILILLPTSSINTVAVVSTENDFLNTANECIMKKDFQSAADSLERLLAQYPGTRNEDVYLRLSDIYDTNLNDYAKAINIYKKYLLLFPEGLFKDRFQERLDYLEKNRDDWDILKKYQFIKSTFYTRSEMENIKMMRGLLDLNPNICLRAEIYIWLANECSYLNKSGQALYYIKKYFATFLENEKAEAEKINAYPLYSEILMKGRQYRGSIAVLKEYAGDDQGRIYEYKARLIVIKKEWRIWTGFLISLVYIALMLMVLIIMKPWREKDFDLIKPILFLKLATLFAVCTLIPMYIVKLTRNGIYKTFPTLAVLGVVAYLLIRLLWPVSKRFGRGVYLTMSFLLTLAFIYISFYIWDTLFIFWTPIRY